MDSDLQRLLAAWLSDDDVDDPALSSLVDRLKTDDPFRKAFVDEVVMLGQLKAVQSSEPRWLKMEDLLATDLDPESADDGFESRVMEGISSVQLKKTDRGKHIWKTPVVAVFAVTLSLAAILFAWSSLSDQKNNTGSDTNKTNSIAEVQPTEDEPQPERNPNAPPSLEAVAMLSQAADAKWSGASHPEIGDSLEAGDLQLESGIVQIEFFSGVHLLLRGPADINLRGPNEVFLRKGTASCYVSEMGRGFRIVTKDMEVIDVGTAFSIDVQEGKESEVHVLQGEVEIKAPSRSVLQLKESKAIRMSEAGPQDVVFAPSRFPQPSELRDEQIEHAEQRYKSWREHAHQLSADPSVLLHYTFEESNPSALELTNRASYRANDRADIRSTATNGVVIGCRWTEGRWPSKRALRYRNVDDRVLFQVPGEFESLTFLAWVRIDGLTQQITSLMMTEQAARRRHLAPTTDGALGDAVARRAASSVQTVRWELNRDKYNVHFNIGHGGNEPRSWRYDATKAPNDATLSNNWGSWACLAVTCDVVKGQVVHYLNGKRIGTGALAHDDPLLLDFMELGNFGVSNDELLESGGLAERRFYGVIDEVVIARRVFDEAELAAIWENGKP